MACDSHILTTGSTHDRGARSALSVLCAIAASALLSACTTVVIPPEDPPRPVSIFILDHGRHTSLVLPTDEGGATRYSYGDWNYYVLDRTGFGSGLRALLWPTRAALGRQHLLHPPRPDTLKLQTGLMISAAHELVVDADAVRHLRQDLDSMFEAAADALFPGVVNPSVFIEHPTPYSLNHNSNRVVGDWLERLGCTVVGQPILSGWLVETR
ncbi:hypothetical protein ACKVEX_09235 [Rhodocyclaceae bacterium SMB388]